MVAPAFALLAVAVSEWMRTPGWVAASLAAVIVIVALLNLRASATGSFTRVAGWIAALAASLLIASVLHSTAELRTIDHDWPKAREAAVTRASRTLGGELDRAVRLARALADGAGRAATLPDEDAFAALGKLTGGGGPAHGVVLFDTSCRPRAWAGVQRTVLRPEGPDLSVVTTPFYLWLVARRQTPSGAAVAAVLLARADDVPQAGVALTDQFAERTGVGLRFLDARAAPPDSDVFDYVQPAGTDTLFAVQPVPPDRGAAYARRLVEARAAAAALLVVVLIAAAALAVRVSAFESVTIGVAALIALARAPLRETLGAGSLFWPDTYFHSLLGPLSSSAGALMVTGAVTFAAGCALWRRAGPPHVAARIAAFLGALGVPFVIQTLARGITPPATGVTIGLWLSWQVAIVLAASALVLVAAALIRGAAVPARAGPWPFVAGGLALAAAAIGLRLWEPGGAWPEWYVYLWAPSLLLAIRPMPFRGTLATVAIVAGSSGALLTWRAATEGRMALATSDIEGLGDRADPLSVALLERLVRQTPVDSVPRTAGDLFVLWRRSALGEQGYPAALAVWGPRGRELSLDLAELDVPPDIVAGVVGEMRADGLPIVRPLLREPGLHGVAAIPIGGGRALTIVVGPRSRLVTPSRQARVLFGAGIEPDPPYEIALAPPSGASAPPAAPTVRWRREGWSLLGDRSISLPGGARHVHATIDLRGPAALLQRGALVLALDVAVLVALWILVEAAAGRAWVALERWWLSARRSLRLRLSVSLGLFFAVPAAAFSIWTLGRFEEQFRGARELLLERTLRDAASVLIAEAGVADTAALDSAVVRATRRVDAELFLSRGGALVATSAPVFVELGLADVLVPADVYPPLALRDEISRTAWQSAAPSASLVAYRLVTRGTPGGAVILAAPDVAGDRALHRREEDLGIAVLVGLLAGALAATLLSGVAARGLARPLQQLRRAALGVGAGEPPAMAAADVPVELESIRDALAQAASDVEAGRRAQRVLAWGEMARQVAHEIKNPLTPIRLGIQHLLRVGRERPGDVGGVLPPTGERILAEIDRLDAIARAFSRFAMPAAEGVSTEAVDLAAVVRDVVNLYRMGEGPPAWDGDAQEGAQALARRDELVEVLVNLCENARNAGARRVVIAARSQDGRAVVEVRDDGSGIPPDVLPRIFEPRFSTTTSGSGLGLAIAKRLVESWGGTIAVVPGTAAGTTVRLELRAPRGAGT